MKKAFSIIELLLAMSFASFLSVVLVSLYQMSWKRFYKAHSMIEKNNNYTIMFHQLERDVTGALIPWAVNLLRPVDKKQHNEPGNDKKNAAFILEQEERSNHSVLKKFSCVTTERLLYAQEERKIRLCRVTYALEKESVSAGVTTEYRLIRLEEDLVDDNDEIINKGSKRRYVVANKIKSFWCECAVIKKDSNVIEFVRSWGVTEEQKKMLPAALKICCVFAADKVNAIPENSFECIYPIFYYTQHDEQDNPVKSDIFARDLVTTNSTAQSQNNTIKDAQKSSSHNVQDLGIDNDISSSVEKNQIDSKQDAIDATTAMFTESLKGE